jgi:hypothetical protein
MAGTRPFEHWDKGQPVSARRLNKGVDNQRANNIVGVPRGNLRRMPNGMSLDIPAQFIPPGSILGTVWGIGPGGEADFTNENYWIWIQYVVAGKWGTTVDMDFSYPYTGTDLTNTIVPATNQSERQPGGPAGSGTHVLRVGTPVFLRAVRGRANTATDTTTVQRFMFMCEDVGVGQYPGQVLVTEAPHTRQWSFITAVPSLT